MTSEARRKKANLSRERAEWKASGAAAWVRTVNFQQRGGARATQTHGMLTRCSSNSCRRRLWGLTLKAAPTEDQLVLTPRARPLLRRPPRPAGLRRAAPAPRPYRLRPYRSIPGTSSILRDPGSVTFRKRAPRVSKAAAHAAARDARTALSAPGACLDLNA